MRRVELQVLCGPNVHSRRSVARLVVTSREETLAAELLAERAAQLLPEGPQWEPLRQLYRRPAADHSDLRWVDVLGATCIELQEERYPTDLGFVAERQPGRESGAWQLVVDIQDADLGRIAVNFACSIVLALQAPAEPATIASARAVLETQGRSFFATRSGVRFNWITALLADAAAVRGVPVAKLVGSWPIGLFGQGHRSQRFWECCADSTSTMSGRISHDKACTTALLRECYIPMPAQRIIRTPQELAAAQEALGFPLVVKGRATEKGKTVTTGITDGDELRRAIAKVREHNDQIIIEKHIPGDDYRFTVIGFKLAGAVRRTTAQVVGDGTSTIRELVERENARRRGHGRYARWIVPLELDREARATLARDGLKPDSVPAGGLAVPLRSAANLSLGGLAEDVTDEVHPEVVRMVERACRLVRLDMAGVDLITTDITRPLSETGGAILELNGRPGLRPHYVTSTPARDVAGAAIDYLFPEPHRGRIPTVVVTGTNGKTTTCRMTARILEASGLTVGLTSTTGISIGGQPVAPGDKAGTRGAMTVLRDPSVEAAVLEMARGGFLAGGLGLEHFDVGVLTNVTLDHLGTGGIDTLEQMAQVKRRIVETARRTVVLNAEDIYCAAMGEDMAAPVWWFSHRADNSLLAAHVGRGGDAVLVMEVDGRPTIVHRRGHLVVPIVEVAAIPATFGGAAVHNVENALAAAAAALALQQPLDSIRRALAAFDNSFAISPGRLNIVDVHGVRIVVDYAHNGAGTARLVETLRSMPVSGRRRCLLIAARSKDLHRDMYMELVKPAAGYFDSFVIAERGDIRAPKKPMQRPLGDSAELMVGCLREVGIAQTNISVVLDTMAAVDAILDTASPGDIVVLAGLDNLQHVWEKASGFQPAWARTAA